MFEYIKLAWEDLNEKFDRFLSKLLDPYGYDSSDDDYYNL